MGGPIYERKCITEGIWQGTGEDKVDKAKQRKKSQTQSLGRKEVKAFNMLLKKKKGGGGWRKKPNQTCITESMIFWHHGVNSQGRSFLAFSLGSQLRDK